MEPVGRSVLGSAIAVDAYRERYGGLLSSTSPLTLHAHAFIHYTSHYNVVLKASVNIVNCDWITWVGFSLSVELMCSQRRRLSG